MDAKNKIVTLAELAQKANSLREQGRCIVHCHGTFDLLHPGHVRHLQAARRQGDVLLVTITADAFISKGPGRPVFTSQLRAESLAALACVHLVAIVEEPTALEAIRAVQPHFYVKGSDYRSAEEDLTGNITREQEAVESFGGRLHFTDDITFSSSSLLNDHFGTFSLETKRYLAQFKERYSEQDALTRLESLRSMQILVIGDTVIQEQYAVEPVETVRREGPFQYSHSDAPETEAMGAVTVAQHLSGFVSQVTLLTGLGKEDRYESFLRAGLADTVEPLFFHHDEAPTLVRRSFVDGRNRTRFAVLTTGHHAPSVARDEALCQWIDHHAADFDAVMVADDGYGLLSPKVIESLCRSARFLAISAEVNGDTLGYQSVTRYPKADFLAMSSQTLRLATHDRWSSLPTLAFQISQPLRVGQMAITSEAGGTLLLDNRRNQMLQAPAFSLSPPEKGENRRMVEASLSLLGLCLAGGLPAELALFLGNAATTLVTAKGGRREKIEPTALKKYSHTLLKGSATPSTPD